MEGFEILKKLGDGAYSIVYKVRRKEDNKIYALKKVKLQNLSDKEKENALNEVRILASVKSPFVISYKEAFIEDSDSSLCLIMEFADKGDLYQKITEFKKMGTFFEEVDIWRIFIQMTLGLKALHDMKILHRDLKSANIFLESDGSAKIGDLNVSKVAKKGLGYTQTGTPYYASPEVWKDQPYDLKSDIWSLGCVTYEMITLHPPFRAQSMEGLYKKVIKGQFPKISDNYSNDLSELIHMLLKVNAGERPSCSQIIKHPIVKKRLDYFQAQNGFGDYDDNVDEAELLKTIRIPKNILFLTERLPGANYIDGKRKKKEMNSSKKNTFPNNNLPSIKRNIGNENKENDNESNKNILLKIKNNDTPSLSNHRIIKSNIINNNNNNKIINENIKVNMSSLIPEKSSNNHIIKSNINIENKPKIILDAEKENNRILAEKENNRILAEKRYQQQQKKKQQKYLEGLGLSEIYKIYAPSLEIINYGSKGTNKKSYEYIYNKNKKPYYNYNTNNYALPKIVPNRRLNPINRPHLRNIGIKN